jgi:hypothetical protein
MPALEWPRNKEKPLKYFFGPHKKPYRTRTAPVAGSSSQMFGLGFTTSRGRYVDYLRQFLIFRPRSSNDQPREGLPGAFTYYFDGNRKP